MATFSREHQLTTIRSWHFLTGPLASLRAVWRAYQVEVSAPSRDADIVHTPLVYFIDPRRPRAALGRSHGRPHRQQQGLPPRRALAAWRRGIAPVTRQFAR